MPITGTRHTLRPGSQKERLLQLFSIAVAEQRVILFELEPGFVQRLQLFFPSTSVISGLGAQL